MENILKLQKLQTLKSDGNDTIRGSNVSVHCSSKSATCES
jgi:hypothetical protein